MLYFQVRLVSAFVDSICICDAFPCELVPLLYSAGVISSHPKSIAHSYRRLLLATKTIEK